MREIQNPKIGLVGIMCTPFRGDKENQYTESQDQLSALASAFGFGLHAIDQGIYTTEDARQAAAELQEWGADFILVQTSSFGAGELIYEFAALPAFLGIWAVPEGPPTEEGGLPLNSFTAANMYNSILKTFLKGYRRPVKWFYGRPGQSLFDDRLSITVQALRAIVNLRGARVGLIGGVAPGFDNLIIDESKLHNRLGVRVVPIEFDEIISRAAAFEEQDVAEVKQTIREAATEIDPTQEHALDKAGRVLNAFQELAQSRDLDAIAVSCWPRFQEAYHFAVCGVMGMANSAGLVAACEGDVTSAVSMLALRCMSAGESVTLMDLSAIDEEDETILLWHCGPGAPSLADENGVRMQSLWLFDGYEGDPIGLHHDMVLKPGLATVMGFTSDFERMLVLDGVFDNAKPSYVGSRGWFTSIRLNGKPISVQDLVQTLMASGFQHHYPVAYGDLAAASLELATWLGMEPIQALAYTPYLSS